MTDSYRDRMVVAREWGENVKHWHGATGGWIYNERGATVMQGWMGVWMSYTREIRDWLTARETAFNSFRSLTEDTSSTYRPTIYVINPRTRVLADEYDRRMQQMMDTRRAYRRGGKGKDLP